MDLHLQGKSILISGGAKGIGAAISMLVAAEGGVAIIADRDEEQNQIIVEKIRNGGGSAFAITIDLMTKGAGRMIVEYAIAKTGQLHGLVNNAGINDRVGLQKGSLEEFEKSLRTNLLHYYDLTHEALPELIKTAGSIVNVSSKTAVTGQGGTSGYVASKGAINALTREWAVELLPYHIRVNAVIPAEVLTPLFLITNPEEKRQEIQSNIPLGHRLTEPGEIANAVTFLLSERSSHTTGQLVFIDGGYTHLDRAL